MNRSPLSPSSLVLTLTALATVGALASDAAARPGNRGRTHDAGNFFMRLSGGVGFGNASFDDPAETELQGVGGMGSFAFGGTVARNIALNADFFGLNMFEPTVKQDGRELGDAEDTSASLGALGVGATFYIMPANLYFAASVGVGVGSIETRGRIGGVTFRFQEDSKAGFAANFMFGKEWWVSRRWGLGLAAQAMFAALETDDNQGLGVFGIGVVFSASMN